MKHIKYIFVLFLVFASTSYASVLHQLSRMPVGNSFRHPYTKYGQIGDFCTGTLIGPKHVLTAAHCIYDVNTKQFEKQLNFSPARNGKDSPLGIYEWQKAIIHPNYIKSNGSESADVGIIILKERLGDKVGWLKYGFNLQNFKFKSEDLSYSTPGAIVGYPGDKESGTMWIAACDFTIKLDSTILPEYFCDTFGGMSGSSLIHGDANGESVVFGVHTNGNMFRNAGIALDGHVLEFVKKTIQENP